MSLRIAAVLLAFVPAFGVAVAAPAPPSTPNPKEQEAAAALKKAGFKLEVAKGDPRLRATDAEWRGKYDRSAPMPTASDLARLRDLPHLTTLRLTPRGEGFKVDEESARHLAALRGLDLFAADGVEFAPGTIPKLAAGLRGLVLLDISSCRLTADDLEALGKLPKLRVLVFASVDITDDELKQFRTPGAFPELQGLILVGCEKVTGKAVAALRKDRPTLLISP